MFDVQADLLLSQQSAGDGEPPPSARAARQRFLECLPPGYAEKTAPEVAARDWLEISRLLALRPAPPPAAGDGGAGAAHMALTPGRAGAPGDFRLRRTALSRAELSSLLRAVESFGLVAEEAVPWHFTLGSEGGDVFIDDVGLRIGTPVAAPGFELGAGGPRLVDALNAAIDALTELSRAQPFGGRRRPELAGGEPPACLLRLPPGGRGAASR